MGRRLSMATRAELLEVVRERYGKARPPERRLILDEFVAVSGYHRKHAIRLLRQPGGGPAPDRRGRSPVYDAAVRAALVVVWEASDRICGKRLKAALPILVPAMERHGHLALDEAVRSRLLAVSAATIDRLLRRHLVKNPGHAGAASPDRGRSETEKWRKHWVFPCPSVSGFAHFP